MTHVSRITSEDGDWETIYFDGVLKHEGHSIHLGVFLESLVGVEITSYTEYEVPTDVMAERPETYDISYELLSEERKKMVENFYEDNDL